MRATEFIVETAEEDRAIISLADAMWDHLQAYKNATRSGYVGTIDDLVDTPLVALTNLRVLLADNETMEELNKDSNASHVSGDKLWGMWDPEQNTVVLNLTKITEKSLKRTIAHELRHALDDVKSKYAAGSSEKYNRPINKDTEHDEYRSKGSEINARFAEVLHTMTIYIAKAKAGNIPNPREYIMDKFHTMMDQKHIYQYFPEKEKSKAYKQLLKRATNFIEKEIAHVFGQA
jgi:hypothetical protein